MDSAERVPSPLRTNRKGIRTATCTQRRPVGLRRANTFSYGLSEGIRERRCSGCVPVALGRGGTRTVAGIFQYGDQDFQQALAVTFPLWHVNTQNGLRVSLIDIDRSVTSAV